MRFRQADLLLTLHRRFGPVVNAGGYVYLLGPEANRFVFANSHLFRWREAFEALVPVDGPTSLIVSDGADHKRRRRLVQPAMHHRQIDGYLQIMADSADAAIDSWRPGQVIDVYQEFRAAIRRSTIHALFGRRMADDAEFFGNELQALLDLVDRMPPVITMLRRLHAPAWRRAMAARARVDERVYAEIDRTRQGSADEDDHVLATLVHGHDADDVPLSDQEIRDQAVTLIAAGYETTSAAMAWAVYAMLTTEGVWDKAKADPAYLSGVVNETLRLYPPAVISARMVAEDFEFAGRRVRAGKLLLFSPYVTHRLPEVWPDPLRFRPERWADHKPAPHEFLPFGGGPHRCIGATFATAELTVMLTRLLAKKSLRLLPQRIRPTGFAAMRPRYGLRAEVRSTRPGPG